MGGSERWDVLTGSLDFVVRGLGVFGWALVEGAMVDLQRVVCRAVVDMVCVGLVGL